MVSKEVWSLGRAHIHGIRETVVSGRRSQKRVVLGAGLIYMELGRLWSQGGGLKRGEVLREALIYMELGRLVSGRWSQ